MADFEIPFTKVDFVQMLSGDPREKTILLLLRALSARLAHVENITGFEATRVDLQRVLAEKDSKCFFYVPEFFWSAWVGVTKRKGADVGWLHGMKLKPWDREFIMAELDMDEVATKLKEAGCPKVGGQFY